MRKIDDYFNPGDDLKWIAIKIAMRDHRIDQVNIWMESGGPRTLYYEDFFAGSLTLFLEEAYPEISKFLLKEVDRYLMRFFQPRGLKTQFTFYLSTERWVWKEAGKDTIATGFL